MSHDIIYNKQFVKLRKTGEVIPILLVGPSNCFDIGIGGRNGRRTRDWSSMRYYNHKGKISEKPDIILKNLDRELNRMIREDRSWMGDEPKPKPADIRAHFGYYASIVVGSGHCADTSWDNYRGVFVNGIKKALTIEELDKLGVNLYFDYYSPNGTDGAPPGINIKTERQYFIELKKWREWQAKSGHSFSLSFSPHNTDRVLERLHAGKYRSPREKTRVEQDYFFVLSNNSGNLVKYTSRGYRYSYSGDGGKRFRTEEDAEKYRKQLVEKGRYKADSWRVEKVEQKVTLYV